MLPALDVVSKRFRPSVKDVNEIFLSSMEEFLKTPVRCLAWSASYISWRMRCAKKVVYAFPSWDGSVKCFCKSPRREVVRASAGPSVIYPSFLALFA